MSNEQRTLEENFVVIRDRNGHLLDLEIASLWSKDTVNDGKFAKERARRKTNLVIVESFHHSVSDRHCGCMLRWDGGRRSERRRKKERVAKITRLGCHL